MDAATIALIRLLGHDTESFRRVIVVENPLNILQPPWRTSAGLRQMSRDLPRTRFAMKENNLGPFEWDLPEGGVLITATDPALVANDLVRVKFLPAGRSAEVPVDKDLVTTRAAVLDVLRRAFDPVFPKFAPLFYWEIHQTTICDLIAVSAAQHDWSCVLKIMFGHGSYDCIAIDVDESAEPV
jgi:hypothetical protein